MCNVIIFLTVLSIWRAWHVQDVTMGLSPKQKSWIPTGNCTILSVLCKLPLHCVIFITCNITHYRCAQCFRPFPDGVFYEFEGRKYCEHDFHVLFAPCCGKCGNEFMSRHYTVITLLPLQASSLLVASSKQWCRHGIPVASLAKCAIKNWLTWVSSKIKVMCNDNQMRNDNHYTTYIV